MNGFKLKEGRLRLDVLHRESGEVLEQTAQGGCRCSVPGGVQDQVGWVAGQPHLVLDLVVGNPVFGQGAWNCTTFEVPSNPNHAMIL